VRDDQYLRLQALNEKLIDAVIVEADPEKWPGDPTKLAEMSRDDRGDRYWCKKNAAATLSVIMKVTSLTGMMERTLRGTAPQVGDPDESNAETDLQREMKAAEREATALLKKIQRRARDRAN
jgi:hypothetical protein